MKAPFLSVIIPAYNEENRLLNTLQEVYKFLSHQEFSAELWIVENGSTDRTFEIAQEFATAHPHVFVLQEPRRGKGGAVQRGMLSAQGEYRFMCDADLSMPVQEITRFFPPLLEGADIAIASREAPGAVRYHEPFYRHWGGRLINLMVRAMLLPDFRDTQCGFKCFRGEVAEDLFSQMSLIGWSFDIEILFLARQRGYRIVEVPIPWYFYPESKLNLGRDAVRMLVDMARIRWKASRGGYARAVPKRENLAENAPASGIRKGG